MASPKIYQVANLQTELTTTADSANNRVLREGDTMTGNLIVPTMNATTINVSTILNGTGANVANAVLKTGDTMTGQLNVSSGGLLVTGNVGIGTASPTATLDVTGNIAFSGTMTSSSATANGVAYFNASKLLTSGSGLVFDGTNFATTGTATATKLIPTGNVTAGNGMYLPTTNTVAWSTNGTERLRLDSAGNLGLGVTPSAWDSNKKAVQVVNASFVGQSDRFEIWSNGYYDGSQSRYVSSNFAALLQSVNGGFNFLTAPSGTAGDTITFSTAMTLNASSQLLMGNGTDSTLVSRITGDSGGFSLWTSNGLAASADGNPKASIGLYFDNNIANQNGAIEFARGGSGTDGNIRFRTNGSERARITADGNLGIGTTSPAFKLDVNGAIQTTDYRVAASQVFFSTGDEFRWRTTTGGERARITSAGYSKFSNDGTYLSVGAAYHELRTNAADYIAYVTNTNATSPFGFEITYTGTDPNGTGNRYLGCFYLSALKMEVRSNGGIANYQGNDVNLSDERVKTDIKPLGSMWDKFKAIEIVTFKYKDQTHNDDNIGVIAQQVESVAPEFVDVDGFGETPEDGVPLKTVYTTDMYHAAIKALQEAMTRIEQLEAKVAQLESN